MWTLLNEDYKFVLEFRTILANAFDLPEFWKNQYMHLRFIEDK